MVQPTKPIFTNKRALLNEESLEKFVGKIRSIGTAACPPYHLAFVIGGTSAELILKPLKWHQLAPMTNYRLRARLGQAFRDVEWENKIQKICQESEIERSLAASTSPRCESDHS